ncbi:hypothetical protein QQP08_000594 [Theobroma cacao]|nr:hypothetical protein QQP08_000594 [Theobroma cacao]
MALSLISEEISEVEPFARPLFRNTEELLRRAPFIAELDTDPTDSGLLRILRGDLHHARPSTPRLVLKTSHD